MLISLSKSIGRRFFFLGTWKSALRIQFEPVSPVLRFQIDRHKMHKNPLVLLFVLNFVWHHSAGLYFHLAEGERKCFIEEVPSETQVTCKYAQIWPSIHRIFRVNLATN